MSIIAAAAQRRNGRLSGTLPASNIETVRGCEGARNGEGMMTEVEKGADVLWLDEEINLRELMLRSSFRNSFAAAMVYRRVRVVELAKRIGWSEDGLRRWLFGGASIDLVEIAKMCCALGVRVDVGLTELRVMVDAPAKAPKKTRRNKNGSKP